VRAPTFKEVNMSDTPEKDKYIKWYEDEKKKGLVDLKFTTCSVFGDEVDKNLTTEDVYKELNAINDAITQGKYTVVAEFNAGGEEEIF
jgi:anion-transporting  ArsA/GET3 family ATPase